MQTNIQKWGNSLAIRIPNFIAKKLAIQNGDAVKVVLDDVGRRPHRGHAKSHG